MRRVGKCFVPNPSAVHDYLAIYDAHGQEEVTGKSISFPITIMVVAYLLLQLTHNHPLLKE